MVIVMKRKPIIVLSVLLVSFMVMADPIAEEVEALGPLFWVAVGIGVGLAASYIYTHFFKESKDRHHKDSSVLVVLNEGTDWNSYLETTSNMYQNTVNSWNADMQTTSDLVKGTHLVYGRYGEANVIRFNLINTTIWGTWGDEENMIVLAPLCSDMSAILRTKASILRGAAEDSIETVRSIQGLVGDEKPTADVKMWNGVEYRSLDISQVKMDQPTAVVGIPVRMGEKYYGSIIYIEVSEWDMANPAPPYTLSVSFKLYKPGIPLKSSWYNVTYEVPSTGSYFIEVCLPEPTWYEIYTASPAKYTESVPEGGDVNMLYFSPDSIPLNADTSAWMEGYTVYVPHHTYGNTYSNYLFHYDRTVFVNGSNTYIAYWYLSTGAMYFQNALKGVISYVKSVSQAYIYEIHHNLEVYDVKDLPSGMVIPSPDIAFPPAEIVLNLTAEEMNALLQAYLKALVDALTKGFRIHPEDVIAANFTIKVNGTVTAKNGTVLIENQTMWIGPTVKPLYLEVGKTTTIDQMVYFYIIRNYTVTLYTVYGSEGNESYLKVNRIWVNGQPVNSTVLNVFTVKDIETQFQGAGTPSPIYAIEINFGAILDWIASHVLTVAFTVGMVASAIWSPRNQRFRNVIILGTLAVISYLWIDPAIGSISHALRMIF